MYCNHDKNTCAVRIVFTCFSGILFIMSSYQSFCYFKIPPASSRLLKSIAIVSNFLLLSMFLHYFLDDHEFRVLYVFTQFFLYLCFCLIAKFYVVQAANYLDDSSFLIKTANIVLYIFLVVLFGLLIYLLVLVSAEIANYKDCASVEWALAKSTTFIIGCVFVVIGIQVSWKLQQQRKKGIQILDHRLRELWYFLYRILIFLIFLSVLISFLNYLTPTLIPSMECDSLHTNDSAGNLAITTIERIFTHFFPISFSIFVFWKSRQQLQSESVYPNLSLIPLPSDSLYS
jgi:hypothetical protein